jgi:hypothetical protein
VHCCCTKPCAADRRRALLIGGAGLCAAREPGDVDAARLQAADSEPQNWFTGGRDKDGSY